MGIFRKKYLFIAVFCFFFLFFTVTDKTSADITTGLVGWWKLDENPAIHNTAIADFSTEGNNGTLYTNDGSTNKSVTGQIGQAIDFDGTDDYINAGTAAVFDNMSAISISMWAKADSYGEWGQGYFISKWTAGWTGWRFQKLITNSTVKFELSYNGGTNLSVSAASNTLTSSDFNKWIYWTVTWDGSSSYSGVHIYKNGVEVAYGTRTDGVDSRADDNTGNLIIGNNVDSSLNRTFDGLIDDVRVYNRALTEPEIEALYTAGAGPEDPYREICLDEGVNVSTSLSNWVTSVSPPNSCYDFPSGTGNYCGYDGDYFVTNTSVAFTAHTPSLPAAGQYQFTFNYNVGSPDQDYEDFMLTIGGQTFTFLDADLINDEQWHWETVTVDLSAGKNNFTFQTTGPVGNSAHFEAFRLVAVSPPGDGSCSTSENVSGWAWSNMNDPATPQDETSIGWISFNSSNCDSNNDGITDNVNYSQCPVGQSISDYDVNINSDGTFSGFAWSENIGWIDFAPAGPYPASPNYPAKMDLTTAQVSGWARALAYGGGWDGWIKFAGNGASWDGSQCVGVNDYGNTNRCNWGVKINQSNGEFSGWAWSDMVIGWISFKGLNYGVKTTFCFNNPPSATPGAASQPNYCSVSWPATTFYWTFSDPDPGDTQSAYQIQIDNSSSGCPSPEVDTGKILSSSNSYATLPGDLTWDTTYYWCIKVWDSYDIESDWTAGSSFQTPVHGSPSPDFTVYPQNPAIDEIVFFTDDSKCYSSPANTEYDCSSGGASISYLWEFGDGQTSTKKGTASTTYATTGAKTAKLTITDDSLSPAASCETTRPVNVTLPLPFWQEIPPF